MKLSRFRAWSPEGKVPVLTSGVLALVLGGFTWAAYREVHHAALSAAAERLDRVTKQLDDILEAGATNRAAEMKAAAAEPALVAYLAAPGPSARRGATATLTRLAAQGPLVAAVELWDTAGRRLLGAGRTLPPLHPETLHALLSLVPSRDTAIVGPLRALGDSLVYSVIAPVGGEAGLLGYVVQHRRVAASRQAAQQLTGLIGSEAALMVGNAAGDVWTDFARRAEGPPVDLRGRTGLVQYERPDRGPLLAQAAPIAGTPWLLVVEFARGPVLARATTFLQRTLLFATLLILAGAAVSWALSRRIIRNSEARLRSVSDTAREAIIGADTRGTIVLWNPGAARMFGYTTAEALGQPLSLLMPPRLREAHAAGLAKTTRRLVSSTSMG